MTLLKKKWTYSKVQTSNFTFKHKVEKLDIGVSPHFHVERKHGHGTKYFRHPACIFLARLEQLLTCTRFGIKQSGAPTFRSTDKR